MGVFELLDEHYNMQQGGRATRQDSLNVYNNSRQVENYYKNLKNYELDDPSSIMNDVRNKNIHNSNKVSAEMYEGAATVIDDTGIIQRFKGISKEDYRKNIDKYRYKQRELSNSTLNGSAPMQLFDKRIHPQKGVAYASPNSADVVEISSYNNIANKPFDLLTEKEKVERVRKYGRDGVPKSYKLPEENNVYTDKDGSKFSTGDNKLTGKPQLVKRITEVPPRDTPQVTPLQQLQQKGIVESDFTLKPIDINIPQFAPTPKSFDIEYSAQRMNGETGYYDQNNVQGVDIETALRAQEQADRMNQYWQEKYGNSQNPKAIERLKQLQDTATITPNYQQGGEYSENEKKFLEEVARLKLI